MPDSAIDTAIAQSAPPPAEGSIDLAIAASEPDPDKFLTGHAQAVAKIGRGKPLTDQEWVPAVQQRDPNANIEGLRPFYESQRKLENARQKFEGAEETLGSQIYRKSIPFASRERRLKLEQSANAAAERIQQGKASDEDYDIIAGHERSQQIEREKGVGGALADVALGAPEFLGEMMTGGKAVSTVAKIPGLAWLAPELAAGATGAKAAPLLPRLAAATGRTVAQTVANPSLYFDPAVARSQAEGGNWYDAKNLAPAFAMGALQMSVLGTLGGQVKSAGPGAANFLKTIGQRTGVGISEQAGIDVAAGALDDISKKVIGQSLGLNTRYGLIGDIVRQDDKGLKDATSQAFMFAGFAALHGNDPAAVTGAYKTFLDDAAGNGLSQKAAGAEAQKVFKSLHGALTENPTMTREQAQALVDAFPDPLQKTLGTVIVNSIPEPPKPAGPQMSGVGHLAEPTGGPPAPEPGTGIINPVQTGVPGIVSGAVEQPSPQEPAAPFSTLAPEEITQLAKQLTGKTIKTAAGLVKELKRSGMDDKGIAQLEDAFKPTPPEAPAAPPSPEEPKPVQTAPEPENVPPGERIATERAKVAATPTEELFRAPSPPEWAEDPRIAKEAVTAEDFSPGGKYYLPPEAPEAPEPPPEAPAGPSRLERMRQGQRLSPEDQARLQADIEAQKPRPKAPSLAEAIKQARDKRAAREGKAEIPEGMQEIRLQVADAMDNPHPEKTLGLVDAVSRAVALADARGEDVPEFFEKMFPRLHEALGADQVKELINLARERDDAITRDSAAVKRDGIDEASFRRALNDSLREIRPDVEAPPPGEGAKAAGPEPVAGKPEGAPAAPVSPSAASSGSPAPSRKLTKKEQRAAELKAKAEGRIGEHLGFGLTDEEWAAMSPIEQQAWRATKDPFLREEKLLKLRGARSLFRDVSEHGGLNKESTETILGMSIKELTEGMNATVKEKLFPKDGRLHLEDLAGEAPGGVINDQPFDAHGNPTETPAAQFWQKMLSHFVIEDIRGADKAHADALAEFLNAQANDYREAIRDEHPEFTTDQVEREVARRMGAAPSSAEEAAGVPPAGEENPPEPGQAQGQAPEQPPIAGTSPPMTHPDAAFAKMALDWITDESGKLMGDPQAAYDAVVKAAYFTWDNLGRLSGKLVPTMTRLHRQSGEAVAGIITAHADALTIGDHFAETVVGPSATPEFARRVGTAILEQRFRDARDQTKALSAAQAARAQQYRTDAADPRNTPAKREALLEAARQIQNTSYKNARKATEIVSLIGGKNSPFQTEQEFQDAWQDKDIKAAIDRYEKIYVPEKEKNFNLSRGRDEHDPIDSVTQSPDRPILALALEEGEAETAGTVRTAGGGNIKNVKLRRNPSETEATLSHGDYETDIREIIKKDVQRTWPIAKNAEAQRIMQENGVAKREVPGQKIEGFKEVPFSTSPRDRGTALYVKDEAYNEYIDSINVRPAESWKKVIAAGMYLPTRASIASGVEAASHFVNLLSSIITKPSGAWHGGIGDLIKNSYDYFTNYPKFREKLVDLARISALKPKGPEAGLLPEAVREAIPWSKWIDPTFYAGKMLDAMSDITRATLGDWFDRQKEQGIALDTVTNKRDFINQSVGQYFKNGQNGMIRFLRETGIGPFATASSTFTIQGIKSLGLGTNLQATGITAAIAMRAEVLAKMGAVLGGIAAFNLSKWGNPLGDDKTPLFHIKVGTMPNGNPVTINLGALVQAPRGLRALGILGAAEASRKGQSPGQQVDKGIDGITNAILHPLIGPGVAFAHTASTGKNTFGYNVAEQVSKATKIHDIAKAIRAGKPPPGSSQALQNLKAAVIEANPVIASFYGKEATKEEKGMFEEVVDHLMQQTGPLAPKERGGKVKPVKHR